MGATPTHMAVPVDALLCSTGYPTDVDWSFSEAVGQGGVMKHPVERGGVAPPTVGGTWFGGTHKAVCHKDRH